MKTIELHLPDDLADEYRLAALENEEIKSDFALIDLENWNDTCNSNKQCDTITFRFNLNENQKIYHHHS